MPGNGVLSDEVPSMHEATLGIGWEVSSMNTELRHLSSEQDNDVWTILITGLDL